VAAVLLPGQRTPALHHLTSDSPTILRFVKWLQREVGPVRCCYEAGPCGFELQRAMTAAGVPCEVIAPALIPRRAGDRIKTDRRDASQLAVLYRAGALTAIYVPPDQEERLRRSSRSWSRLSRSTRAYSDCGVSAGWTTSLR
jgi:transposase